MEEAQEKLSDDFITEEAFFKKMQEHGYRDRLEAKLTGHEEGELRDEFPVDDDKLDERIIEEVLKKDLTSLN